MNYVPNVGTFQADLRAQYDKEQELYQNKSLLSKESKDKLEVNFMYEPPPGIFFQTLLFDYNNSFHFRCEKDQR